MFKLIEGFINNTLTLDPRTPIRLLDLKGKHLKIEITNFSFVFYIEFTNIGIQISKTPLQDPNATVKGPLNAFITLVIHKNPKQAANHGLIVEGDISVAEAVQTLFLTLEIDWEELLSHWTGDVIAHQIGNFFRTTQKSTQKFMQSLIYSTSEYIKEEIKIAPTQEELDHFLRSVDKLRQDVDRAEAKLNYLSEKLA